MPNSRRLTRAEQAERNRRIIDTAMCNRHATGRQIAAEQGVSPSTVSRVLRRRLGLMIGDPPRRARRPDMGAGSVHLDLWPSALNSAGREQMTTALVRTETLAGLIGRTIGQRVDGPITGMYAAINSTIIDPLMWSQTLIKPGDIVTLRVRPQGGDDSDPLRIVLQIALIVVAITLPPLLGFAAGTVGAALVSGAVLVGGQFLIDAVAPVRQQDPPDLSGRKPDQSYSLSGGANRARPHQPLPLVLGTHRMFPDLGARDYNTHSSVRNQNYYAIYNFGVRLSPDAGGGLHVRDLRVGSSRLDDYDDVETQWDYGHSATSAITLVSGNVDAIPGAVLEDTDWVTRRTPSNTDYFELDFGTRIFQVGRKGGIYSHSVDITYQYRLIPSRGAPPEWTTRAITIIGDPDSDDHQIVLPPRLITTSLSGNSATPWGRTLRTELLTPGAYEVRVRRNTAKSTSTHITDDITWSVLRSYQPDTASYYGQTRLAVSIRATGQLSGRLDALSGLVTQYIPTLKEGSDEWRIEADGNHSNPAAIYRAYCLGNTTPDGSLCGINLPRSRIDDASLAVWYRFCEDNELTCNLVLTAPTSHAEVLNIIGACGRASPTWASGALGVVIDNPDTPVSALIHPGNIVAGSCSIEWADSKTADRVGVRFLDPDLDNNWHTIWRTVPGVERGATTRPAVVSLRGVTNAKQAAAEANQIAARQIYHRRRIIWEMGMEGRTIQRGDVVYITHALLDGGITGRIASAPANNHIALRPANTDGDPLAIADGDHILLRLGDGHLHTSAIHPAPGGIDNEIILLDPLPDPPPDQAVYPDHPNPADPGGYLRGDPDDCLWRLYDSTTPPHKARIISLQPNSDGRIRFVAIDEVDEYHEAAQKGLEDDLPALPNRRPAIVGMAITERLIRVGKSYAVELIATLTTTGDWRGGEIRVTRNDIPDQHNRLVATLSGPDVTATWISEITSGRITITALPAAFGAQLGDPFVIGYTIIGVTRAPAAPTNFLLDILPDGQRRFRWTPPADPDVIGYQIRYAEQGAADSAPEWDDMTPLHTDHITASPLEVAAPPRGNWRFALRALDVVGNLSPDVRIVAALGDPPSGETLGWRCPSAEDWPGKVLFAARSDDGANAIEALGHHSWAEMDDTITWANWRYWGVTDLGRPDTPNAMIYEPPTIVLSETADITTSISWDVLYNSVLYTREDEGAAADPNIELVVRERHIAGAETLAALEGKNHRIYQPGTLITARRIDLQFSIRTKATDHRYGGWMDHLCYTLHGNSQVERLLDTDTSTWSGNKADGRIIPTIGALGAVTHIALTLQSVGPGWSWEVINKRDPRIKIYNGDGDPADATVDVILTGVPAAPATAETT